MPYPDAAHARLSLLLLLWAYSPEFEAPAEGVAVGLALSAGRFTAWIRVWDSGSVNLCVGASDDLWLLINDEVVYSDVGVHAFTPSSVDIELGPGQFPLEVRYAHRSGPENGLRFRVASGDVTLCYPDFSDDDAE